MKWDNTSSLYRSSDCSAPGQPRTAQLRILGQLVHLKGSTVERLNGRVPRPKAVSPKAAQDPNGFCTPSRPATRPYFRRSERSQLDLLADVPHQSKPGGEHESIHRSISPARSLRLRSSSSASSAGNNIAIPSLAALPWTCSTKGRSPSSYSRNAIA